MLMKLLENNPITSNCICKPVIWVVVSKLNSVSNSLHMNNGHGRFLALRSLYDEKVDVGQYLTKNIFSPSSSLPKNCIEYLT